VALRAHALKEQLPAINVSLALRAKRCREDEQTERSDTRAKPSFCHFHTNL
jgi:hypothetical protein